MKVIRYNVENMMIGKLFKDLSISKKREYFEDSMSKVIEYDKDEFIFYQYDRANYLYVLLEGAVDICQETSFGNRVLITRIQNIGDMFGEVYLFLKKDQYDFGAVASKKAKILQIPKESFLQQDNLSKSVSFIRTKMLEVLAEKAYYLNKKIRMMSGITIRQKLSIFLLENMNDQGIVHLEMNREDLANYFSITRPSLSRELSLMKEEGIIEMIGKSIKICDITQLECIK